MTITELIVNKYKEKKTPQKLLGVRLDKDKVDDLMRLSVRYNVTLKALINGVLTDFLSKEMKSRKK